MVINAADTRFDGWFEDTFVTLEAVLLSQAITQLTKSAVNRTSPFVYSPHATQADLESPDAVRSFVSGHSSFAFAAATAYTFTSWKRHPASPWRFVVLGGSHALAASVALLIVQGGFHYPTDAIAGALVGSSMGLLVPVLHSRMVKSKNATGSPQWWVLRDGALGSGASRTSVVTRHGRELADDVSGRPRRDRSSALPSARVGMPSSLEETGWGPPPREHQDSRASGGGYAGAVTAKRPAAPSPRNDGTPGKIRTYDIRLRRPTLYPAELRARVRRSAGLHAVATARNGAAQPRRNQTLRRRAGRPWP